MKRSVNLLNFIAGPGFYPFLCLFDSLILIKFQDFSTVRNTPLW